MLAIARLSRIMLFVYIPILLQGAALVAVRHCRVTNFPSGVRTATRAAPQMADTTHERPKVSPLSPHKAEGPSAVSASHTYHLCGSIISAALREKSYNQALVRKIRRFRVMRHNDFPLKTKPIKPFVPAPRA